MRLRLLHSLPVLALGTLFAACTSNSGETATTDQSASVAPSTTGESALYELEVNALDGSAVQLADYRGRALLMVNVASKCGLTPQYKDLEKLQQTYGDRGLTVIGFPCNQFGGQEPGTPGEIQSFCTENYGVSFPLMEKLEVNGPGRDPIYQLLTAVPDANGTAGDVQWNFEKFVISADGTSITRFRPRTGPLDPSVISAIEAALPNS
jgi:glutathione peroxidase